jgi:hypothetical protein
LSSGRSLDFALPCHRDTLKALYLVTIGLAT